VKRIIFLVAALLTVFSGIAAVTAYEGHAINIKAHVEAAIGVVPFNGEYGTRFPQEGVEANITFATSKSFRENTRLSTVYYNLYWELMPKPPMVDGKDVICPVYEQGFYQPINPFFWDLTLDTNPVVAPNFNVKPTAATNPLLWYTGSMFNATVPDNCESLHFMVAFPNFEGYYNALTDALVKPNWWTVVNGSANWLLKAATDTAPAEFCVVDEELSCGDSLITVPVPHADLGIILKIQVTGFAND